MALQKLTSTDAFVVVDLPDAPASGVVRRGKKILQSSAKDLARSATYSFGAFGVERSGASAGINAVDEAASEAVAAFVSGLVPVAAERRLHLEPGKGVESAQLAELRAASGVGPHAGSEAVLVAGITAATAWAFGGSLAGRSVAIEGARSAPPLLRSSLMAAGATVVDVWGATEKPWLVWGAEVDAILAGSKPGTLTHQGAGHVKARAVVPWGPLPVTTKAFAQLRQGDEVVVLPDFVTIAGGLLAGLTDGDEAAVTAAVVPRVTDVLEEAGAHPDGVLLGACYQAEAFIESWQGSKPFGRPLAA
ncbi:MAG: hypothetical protein GY724_19635 [Actinomycetia bacterium]|nr:hypothetical protein [Actinomycetes bacterium]